MSIKAYKRILSLLDVNDTEYTGKDGFVLQVNEGSNRMELGAAGTGDMVLASVQTVTGAKTFEDGTLLLRNVADTFNGVFTNTNTADRIYTFQNSAGTIAFTSDITGTNSGTNTGDQTSIVGITGTKSEFDTSVTNGDFLYVGDVTSNVSTALSIGTVTATTFGITSDGGTDDVVLPEANTTQAGLLGSDKWDEIVANTLKVSNVSTDLSMGTVDGTQFVINSSDGNNVSLPLADTNNWGIISDEIFDNITTNNAKVSNASHTGDVTGDTALTIGANKVTLGMMAQVATDTFLGRVTAATGNVEVLTNAQAKTALDLTGTNSGDQDEEDIIGTRLTDATVTGSTSIDWDAYKVFEFTLTGNTTITDSNLPTGTETKVIEMVVTGNFTLTLPAYYEALPSNDTYDGTVRNHLTISCIVGTTSSEDVIYSLQNLTT